LNTSESKLVLEKPIGKDLESAKAINEGVGAVFPENSIYRIDHYLGKETVQNLLVLRFANALLEPVWQRNAIDHVQITMDEDIGLEGRADYYDRSGAVRDMVQNHLLQLLCLTAMEPPNTLDADDVRTEKIKVLKALKRFSVDTVKQNTVRGQYTTGIIKASTPKYGGITTSSNAYPNLTDDYLATSKTPFGYQTAALDTDPNKQESKLAFLENEAGDIYNSHTLQSPSLAAWPTRLGRR